MGVRNEKRKIKNEKYKSIFILSLDFTMKKLSTLFLFFFASLYFLQAQQRQKMALFIPLHLDSAFDAGGGYRYDKTFPKYLNPGVEFYLGAQAALDSLNKAGAPLDVFVYDSKSRRTSVAQQVNSPELSDVSLIVGHSNVYETRMLADAAVKRKVPFVSATLPNDAGITANPYYVVLNATLRTHTEGIYHYLQKYHALDRIIVFRKPGIQETQIKEYLEEMAKSTGSVPLKIQYADIGGGFNSYAVTSLLDSTRKTVCIAGSLDEAFGMRLAQTLAAVGKNYPLTVVGMPTWDGLSFTKPEFKSIEIVYSTPFNYGRWTSLGTRLASDFETRMGGRPTDMYFRGYETVLRFALLLLDTKKDIASNLTRKGNYVFTQFDLQPVFLNKQNMTLDYFENKKLYFIRILNGVKSTQ